MDRQEKKATIISFITIAVFMAAVASVQGMRGAANEQKVNLLALAANSFPSSAGTPLLSKSAAPAAAPTLTTTTPPKEISAIKTTGKTQGPLVPPPATAITQVSAPLPPPLRGVFAASSSRPVAVSKKPPPSVAIARPLPYSVGTFGNDFTDGDGWINLIGTVSQKGGVLTISADASTTAGGALLNGSSDWSDYTFQTTLDWVRGETFGLMADYVDPKNFLVCEFDERNVGTIEVSFEKHVNGVVTSLATNNVINYEQMGGDDIMAAIEVHDNVGTCSFNNQTVSSVFDLDVATSSQKGEIGFTTWDPQMNNSEIIVHTVGVINGAYQFGS